MEEPAFLARPSPKFVGIMDEEQEYTCPNGHFFKPTARTTHDVAPRPAEPSFSVDAHRGLQSSFHPSMSSHLKIRKYPYSGQFQTVLPDFTGLLGRFT